MPCPRCRQPTNYPWQHEIDCVDGLRHQIRWYQFALAVAALALLSSAILLLAAFLLFARLG